MPDWYRYLRRARDSGVPFWPAPSILDMPCIIFDWQTCAAEAEAKAQSQRERLAARRAAMQAQPVRHIS